MSTDWKRAGELMDALERACGPGMTFVVKLDRMRANGQIYTVALTRGPGDDFFRKDTGDLVVTLTEALEWSSGRTK